MVIRSQYVRGTDFKQDIVEYAGNICYNLTSGNSFINCTEDLTGKVYIEKLLPFFEMKSEEITFRRQLDFKHFKKKMSV